MDYSYYDLGQRKRGETIEVSLSAAATDKVALSTATYTINEIAEEIASVVGAPQPG
jgi:hypothetical protein